jgi:hypothetical protein
MAMDFPNPTYIGQVYVSGTGIIYEWDGTAWVRRGGSSSGGGSGEAPVTSVNGEIGEVVLDAADVGAAPLGHTHPIAEVNELQTVLDGKAANVHSHAIADVTGLQTALDGKAPSAHNHDADYVNISGDTMTGPLSTTGLTVNALGKLNAANEIFEVGSSDARIDIKADFAAGHSVNLMGYGIGQQANGGDFRWYTGDTEIMSLTPNSILQTTSQMKSNNFLSTGALGLIVQSATPEGGNLRSTLGTVNPGWSDIVFDSYHVPGVWAGGRIVVAGTTVFQFTNSGVGYAPGGWQVGSDRALKTNITPIDNALDRLSVMGGYEYDRTDLTNYDGTPLHQAGVIAQEVQLALEAGVSTRVSGETKEGATLAVDPMAVIALLVNAVNELNAKVDALTAAKGA